MLIWFQLSFNLRRSKLNCCATVADIVQNSRRFFVRSGSSSITVIITSRTWLPVGLTWAHHASNLANSFTVKGIYNIQGILIKMSHLKWFFVYVFRFESDAQEPYRNVFTNFDRNLVIILDKIGTRDLNIVQI